MINTLNDHILIEKQNEERTVGGIIISDKEEVFRVVVGHKDAKKGSRVYIRNAVRARDNLYFVKYEDVMGVEHEETK